MSSQSKYLYECLVARNFDSCCIHHRCWELWEVDGRASPKRDKKTSQNMERGRHCQNVGRNSEPRTAHKHVQHQRFAFTWNSWVVLYCRAPPDQPLHNSSPIHYSTRGRRAHQDSGFDCLCQCSLHLVILEALTSQRLARMPIIRHSRQCVQTNSPPSRHYQCCHPSKTVY